MIANVRFHFVREPISDLTYFYAIIAITTRLCIWAY